MSSADYQRLLYRFIDKRQYVELGWAVDKYVRDTGPYIDNTYYGTHDAVRIFYSPEVIEWLEGGRKGSIRDGAMIIKEMFSPPAARYDSVTPRMLDTMVSAWAIMVRDSIGSKDGWYWSFYAPGQKVDDPDRYPFDYPNSDFGVYCVRCHASADREFTFSSPANIEGFPGEPVTFRVDNSWIPGQQYRAVRDTGTAGHGHGELAGNVNMAELRAMPAHQVNADFAEFYNQIPVVSYNDVQRIPPVTYDHVIVGPEGPEQFVTSDQCLSCHDGQPPNLGPNMYIPISSGKGINLSPYGEWNWSMMGLAGRDPIFHAQIESEIRLQPKHAAAIQNLCFTCHGVMGQRQLTIDHPDEMFSREMVYIKDHLNPNYKYGALARDGISCTVCHQIVDDKLPLDSIVTGRFHVSRPGEFEPGVSYIYGPFENPPTVAMHTSLGMKPVQSDYIKSSRLCGSCHSVLLPVYDAQGKQVGEFFEQSTYIEWLNSDYQDELGKGGKTPKTCQTCHMPQYYPDRDDGQKLAFRIANIQDQTYPEAEHRQPIDSITVKIRQDYARHTLLGVNIFALQMFKQFDEILGIRKTDFMTGNKFGLDFAIEASNLLAKEKTATVEILDLKLQEKRLKAKVRVTNLTGHRLPSGVGFRRAFLAFSVVNARGEVVWASGGTNSLGVIVDGEGKPLPTEFFEVDPKTGAQQYQKHHSTITMQSQVQIYEELVRNPAGMFTTSFLALADPVKENRLLPIGWTPNGPPGFKYAAETRPHGAAAKDPDFTDGTGSDIVEYDIAVSAASVQGGKVVATLYYQSIPPSYLRDRFRTAPDGRGTQRLHYLASHLQTDGTPVENWKLELATAASSIR